jgi:hypothetical protein
MMLFDNVYERIVFHAIMILGGMSEREAERLIRLERSAWHADLIRDEGGEG